VGYDDTKGTPDAPGAFLVQNSFGEAWPPGAPGGRIWISYASFLATQVLGAVAYPRDTSPPSGQPLASPPLSDTNPPPAPPAASIQRAFQAPVRDGAVVVLMHRFADPVFVKSVTFTGPGGKVVVANVNQPIQTGYTYLRRADGKAFPVGKWTVAIEGTIPGHGTVAYSGKVDVGPVPPGLVAAGLGGTLFGPTGQALTAH
jgi:hypothetical protein